jgi:hypothetical protein
MPGAIDYWCNQFTPDVDALGLGAEARTWLPRETARKVFKL